MGNAWSENAAWERESQAANPTLPDMPDGLYLVQHTSYPLRVTARWLADGQVYYCRDRQDCTGSPVSDYKWVSGPMLSAEEWQSQSGGSLESMRDQRDAALETVANMQAELTRLRAIEAAARKMVDDDRAKGWTTSTVADDYRSLWFAIYPDDAKPASEPPPVGSVWGVRSEPMNWLFIRCHNWWNQAHAFVGFSRRHRSYGHMSQAEWASWVADKERIDEAKS